MCALQIVDFGVSFKYEPGQLLPYQGGTLRYMAPEALE